MSGGTTIGGSIFSTRMSLKRRMTMSNKRVRIGDIFVASWGYDQTNVDWYVVVKKRGKTQIVLHPIGSCIDQEGAMEGMSYAKVPSHDWIDEKAKGGGGLICKVQDADRPWVRINRHATARYVTHLEATEKGRRVSWYA